MFVLENTAVNSRKNTRMTIISIIGTMFRSLRPRYFAWLRAPRAASFDEAIFVSSAVAGRALPWQSTRTRRRGARHRGGRLRGRRLRVALGDRIQELHHRD